MDNESTLITNEIYIPIFEKDGKEITVSQGKGAIFFSTEKRALEFLEETKQKDPNGHLKDCSCEVVKYVRGV